MKKSILTGKISLFLKGAILAMVWFQAIVAIVWGIANIASIQPFEQTKNYLSIADCLRTVGYDSVGYAYFIGFCRVMQRITRIPYFAVAYLLQILLCNSFIHNGCAAFLRGITGKKVSNGLVAMVTVLILTNPFVWQMIFAILPDALAFSLTIYGIGNAFLFAKTVGKEKNFTFAFATLFSLFLLIYIQRYSFYVCFGCSALMCIAVFFKILFKKDSRNKGSVIRELIFAAGMTGLLLLALFVVFSDRRIAGESITEKTTLKQFFSGTFLPFVLAKREYPFGDNVNALYLNIMWQKRPLLTYFYVSAARVGFAASIVCMFLKGLMDCVGNRECKVSAIIRNAVLFGILILAAAAYGAWISPAGFDFRYFFVPCMIWVVWGASMHGFIENNKTVED